MAVNEIAQHFIKTFEQNVLFLAQQKYSKLRRTVTEKSPGGTTSHSFPVVAPRTAAMHSKATAGLNASKRAATPYADTVFNDRVALPLAYDTADSYEWDDVVRQIQDPQSKLTTTMAMQAGRQIDDIIIAKWFAAALDGIGTSNAHPAGSQVGGATQAFNFDFVRLIREQMLEKDIDPDEQIFLVVSPNAVMSLLDETQASSVDYTSGKALMSGNMVEGWMGFTWIMSNRIPAVVAGPPAQKYYAAYTKDSMGLVVNKEPFFEVAKDPGQSFSTVVYMGLDMGAVRIQDEKCFRVHVLETN